MVIHLTGMKFEFIIWKMGVDIGLEFIFLGRV